MRDETRQEKLEVQDHLISRFLERASIRRSESRGYQRYDALKGQYEETEGQAAREWAAFCEDHLQVGHVARSRGNPKTGEKAISDTLEKMRKRLTEWRKYNVDDIDVAYKRFRLEERLLSQKEAVGHDNAENNMLFQELKTELHDYQKRLKKQEHDLHHLAQRERSSVNEITHINEKLEYFESLQEDLSDKLRESEEVLETSKRRLFDAHVRRDAGREKKTKLLESSELLTRQRLTDDFEEKVTLRNELIAKL
ncbi:hypothetical protein BV898_07937 [Hypsibius exemplaris]|uniref:CCDC113/CCDC96 coiled-coil domain-containing protein n=1 Tax=Hypsibius exemplaris TaxID=2072580 RepID=A0A1W0WS23_HYPEX|nr:hypothetical protein BV898_07937 [Hypsibius exemplaris]